MVDIKLLKEFVLSQNPNKAPVEETAFRGKVKKDLQGKTKDEIAQMMKNMEKDGAFDKDPVAAQQFLDDLKLAYVKAKK